MPQKIIIAADELIVCPRCAHRFTLDQGITRQTIERYESEFEQAFDAQRKELEAAMTHEAQRKAGKQFADQIAKLQEQLGDTKKSEQEARALIAKAQAEAKSRAEEQFAQERKAMAEDMADKEAKLKAFREQELALRKQQRQVEEQQANMQLEMQRKFDEERTRLTQQIGQKEAERFSMMEAEYRKKIEDAQKANEELRRKLDQGSQQLQGEILELELEQTLTSAFFHDLIEEVKKGQRGADVVQTVRTPAGQACGKIIWEAKRAENWSDRWLTKLKDDQQVANADVAVLVTTVMPKGVSEPFGRLGDVWIVAPHAMRPVADMLRVTMLELQRLKVVNTGRSEKMEQLYNYLASPQFAQRVRTMLDSFEAMRGDLEAEKRAMQKIWVKRQSQIERVTSSMITVVGELQAIAQDSLPQLEAIESIASVADDSAEEN